MAEIEFVAGMIVKPPHERAPDFVQGSISIKVDEFVPWLKAKMAAKEEWINLDLCEAKSGKWYAKVNDYKPKEKEAPKAPKPAADPFDGEIPF